MSINISQLREYEACYLSAVAAGIPIDELIVAELSDDIIFGHIDEAAVLWCRRIWNPLKIWWQAGLIADVLMQALPRLSEREIQMFSDNKIQEKANFRHNFTESLLYSIADKDGVIKDIDIPKPKKNCFTIKDDQDCNVLFFQHRYLIGLLALRRIKLEFNSLDLEFDSPIDFLKKNQNIPYEPFSNRIKKTESLIKYLRYRMNALEDIICTFNDNFESLVGEPLKANFHMDNDSQINILKMLIENVHFEIGENKMFAYESDYLRFL